MSKCLAVYIQYMQAGVFGICLYKLTEVHQDLFSTFILKQLWLYANVYIIICYKYRESFLQVYQQ